jgi:hypothetical protein
MGQEKQKNITFSFASIFTVPDELGTEADEFLNQRLIKKDRERKRQYSQKLDSTKQKIST